MEDDDDDFLYGPASAEPTVLEKKSPPVFEPQPVKPIQPLDAEETFLGDGSHEGTPQLATGGATYLEERGNDEEDGKDDKEAEEEDEEEESDIEIIVDPEERNKSMQRDFRPQGGARTTSFDMTAASGSGTPPPTARAPHLTTEYTPTPRGEAIPPKAPIPPPYPPPQRASSSTDQNNAASPSLDPSTLPPVLAPPSHPPISISEPGVLDGRPIFEVDMDALAEKPWRRPGSDLSDYFNYGFDEVSWEAYCYRRRDLGEMANHLKGVVTNFAGMPEEQITALPPEVRAMVMTGATSLMSNGPIPHGGPAMMNVGVGGPNQMIHANPHDMGMMGVMNGSDIQNLQVAGMMQGAGADNDVMNMQNMAQDGFSQNVPVPGPPQMMGMAQEFGIQDPSAMNLYQQNMEGGGTPNSVVTQIPPSGPVGPSPPVIAPTGPAATRNPAATPQTAFRGRGTASPAMGMRGRGGFVRGRGRGGMFGTEVAPPIPVRPASPLPPGVPTGPRNQNRYKDRDGNAPAVDGLDYGGTQPGNLEADDRGRKRRGSPNQDDSRSSKRR